MTKYIFVLLLFTSSISEAKINGYMTSIHIGYTLKAGINFGFDVGYYHALNSFKTQAGLVISRNYIYRKTRVDAGFHTITQLKVACKYDVYDLKWGYGIIKNRWRKTNTCYTSGSNFEIGYRLSKNKFAPELVYQLQKKQYDWEWMDFQYHSLNVRYSYNLKDLDNYSND